MRTLPAIGAFLACAASAMTQSTPPPRYRIIPFDTTAKFQAAINAASADHYRFVLAGSGVLMEHTDSSETYKYVLVENGLIPVQLRDVLNASGARGYRLVGAMGRRVFPSGDLLMEKAPGRPNQFQYVLESGHHLTTRGIWLHDDFSRGPPLIAARVREGYFLAAQVSAMTVLEKPAEPTGDTPLCGDDSCYHLRVMNLGKHFEESLNEAGSAGYRFMSAAFWQGMSGRAYLILFTRHGLTSPREYRTVPARHDKAEVPLKAALADGFCIHARVDDVIVLERSSGSPHCEYQILHGLPEEVERDLNQLAADGYRPVLLSPEGHAGFRKYVMKYTLFVERPSQP